MTKLDKALAAISSCNDEDMNYIQMYLNDRVRAKRAALRFNFRIGQTVTFTARRGRQVTGTVMKINRTSISVSTPIGKWRVAPSLLKVA